MKVLSELGNIFVLFDSHLLNIPGFCRVSNSFAFKIKKIVCMFLSSEMLMLDFGLVTLILLMISSEFVTRAMKYVTSEVFLSKKPNIIILEVFFALDARIKSQV